MTDMLVRLYALPPLEADPAVELLTGKPVRPDHEPSHGPLALAWSRRAVRASLPFGSSVRTRDADGLARAAAEVDASTDRLIYYAGWADKYQQIFSAVNPVSSSHFNFSVLEPTGVVAIIAPDESGLLGLVSNVMPAIVGGNTCVVLASESLPLCAVSFAEVLHASDVPPGVVNVLTGYRSELTTQFASHMDVNAIVYTDGDPEVGKSIQVEAAQNIKRVIARPGIRWDSETSQSPYLVQDTQETKTTWHPIGA